VSRETPSRLGKAGNEKGTYFSPYLATILSLFESQLRYHL
jgi:hypothetical protein